MIINEPSQGELTIAPHMRGSLEQVPVFVFDASVLIYGIYHRLDGILGDLNNQSQQNHLKAHAYLRDSLTYLRNLTWLSPNPVPERAIILWAGDAPKPYWRHSFTPNYKGGRKIKHDFWHIVERYYREQAGPLYFPTYEADDVAALVRQLWVDRKAGVGDLNLVTIDSDWQGLVTRSRGNVCQVLQSGNYSPRVRAPGAVITWLEGKIKKMSKGKQRQLAERIGQRELRPSDVWLMKQVDGDASDNLPAGSPLDLFHLLEPPMEKRLWLQPAAVAAAKNKLRQVSYPDPIAGELAAIRIYQAGLELPVQPLAETMSK